VVGRHASARARRLNHVHLRAETQDKEGGCASSSNGTSKVTQPSEPGSSEGGADAALRHFWNETAASGASRSVTW
jgi:hypothetical protein